MMAALEEDGLPVTIEKPISMEGRFMSVIVTEDSVKAASMAKAAAADGPDPGATEAGQPEEAKA
jgi:hypothetical protein